MPESAQLRASFAYCRRIARKAARNFYYGFRLLPRPKGEALCALYAFMRQVDDISDSPGDLAEKTRCLAEFRAAFDRALMGEYASNCVWPALHHTVLSYAMPPRYFHDLISGAEMDLSVTSYATFERLREYCYRVAGTVGLTCLHVFGFRDPRAPELAEKLGIAFQLTNIIRDVRGDFAMGRVYLPQEDLERFGCHSDDLTRAVSTPAWRDLLRFEAERAWQLYEEGVELVPLVSVDSQPALWALVRIYSGILRKIEASGYDVFASPHIHLSAAAKTWILVRARLGFWPHDYVSEERDRDRRRAGGALLGRRAG